MVTRRCRRACGKETISDANGSSKPVRFGALPPGNDLSEPSMYVFGEVCDESIDMVNSVFPSGIHRPHDHPIAQHSKANGQPR